MPFIAHNPQAQNMSAEKLVTQKTIKAD